MRAMNPGTYKRTPLQTALRKRKEAVLSIAVHTRWIEKLELRIRELDYEINALGGPPKPRKSILPFRAAGEFQRTMFDLMRERGAITAVDLAAAMAAIYSLDTTDKAVMHALRQRAVQCFARNAKQERIVQAGWSESKTGRRAHGRFMRWRLQTKDHPCIGSCCC